MNPNALFTVLFVLMLSGASALVVDHEARNVQIEPVAGRGVTCGSRCPNPDRK
ncbi:hypothetical protein CALVIDRAFT_602373 [Calocera viscosa TUFC12733]|uniref:Uncharacterized protein n=1 Tax=Calocera viscosa (strain TUFC12733) TaxID=1330018 RepID=A0A167H4V8_CALVF|nr:hypothetical protein CALVIDRAFT_602373 [Calocera viscosa TUFC12733]